MYKALIATIFAFISFSGMAADWSVNFGFHSHGRESVRPSYYCPPVYRAYPVYPVYRPAPVFSIRIGAQGRYETVTERVCVASERVERVYVPPVLETRIDPNGVRYSVVVQAGYYKDVVYPAQYEYVSRQVWVQY